VGFKGREPLFLLGILLFHNMNIDISMSRMQWEKTELKRAHGQAGRPSVAGWPQFPLKNSGVLPKFPYKLLNSLLPLILEIWKENFDKREILI
jgi:hypothetical protein